MRVHGACTGFRDYFGEAIKCPMIVILLLPEILHRLSTIQEYHSSQSLGYFGPCSNISIHRRVRVLEGP